MKLELLILAVAGFIIYNIYYDGKYLKIVLSWKKYYQMGFVAFMAIILYLLIKRNPMHCKNILLYANNMVKYMPIDKSSMHMISPIIDFTTGISGASAGSDASRSFMQAFNSEFNPNSEFNNQIPQDANMQANMNMHAGKKATKRSVSEGKKKFIAAQQDWKCFACKKQLTATFQVDHTVRLEHGGSNDVTNLTAMCVNCHSEKTLQENL
jgi:hypothetical protein